MRMQMLAHKSRSMVGVDPTEKEKSVSYQKHNRHQVEWYAGAIVFAIFVGAHFMFGIKAAVKVAGAACVATGILWMLRRSVPVGIEGRPPSHDLRGWGAVLAGLVITVVGLALLAYSGLAACLLGWASDGEC